MNWVVRMGYTRVPGDDLAMTKADAKDKRKIEKKLRLFKMKKIRMKKVASFLKKGRK